MTKPPPGRNSAPAAPRRARGRPRDPARRAAILQTAEAHFHTLGYERTSLDAVAQEAGVSKMTIYSYFPSKEALFGAAITERTNTVFDFSRVVAAEAETMEQVLTRVAKGFLALMRSPEVVGQFRALYGASEGHRDAALTFWRSGPEHLIEQLTAHLETAVATGSLDIPDPAVAADQFLALFLGGAHIRQLLGMPAPTARYDQRLVAANVAMFMAAYGNRKPKR